MHRRRAIRSDATFAASYAAAGVANVSATAEKTSCYRPEVFYGGVLPASAGYPGGGTTTCPPAVPTTGENSGPYDTQDAVGAGNPDALVKDHSESDIRVDPADPIHLIGQSKWFVNAEGYNHLLGFYESFDGGQTWPVQGMCRATRAGPTTLTRWGRSTLGATSTRSCWATSSTTTSRARTRTTTDRIR